MAFATLNDLIDRYGEALLVNLTDRGATATGIVDAASVDQALDHASAEIEGYLAGRYVLPLAEVPVSLVDIACVLAVHRLHIDEPSAKIRADYETAQKRLREIAAGTFRLQVAGVVPADTGAGGARVTDRERPMTEDNLKAWI